MEILLIRHALPLRVESDRPVDPPLAPRGHDQAAALARWLEDEPPDHLIVSTMQRAIDTAQHLADTFALDMTTDPDLCELDRGSTAYIPLEELDRDDPRLAEFIDKFVDDWLGPGGLERRTAFQARVVAALDRHLDSRTEERIAVVCHGGVINALLSHILGCDRMMFFQPAYTSISRITLDGNQRYRIGSVNESGHLRDLDAAS